MDFVRTLKKRRPKKHARVPGAKPRKIRIKKRCTTLNVASCFAFFLGLAVTAPSQAEDYYFYKGSKGELVISNKEPPPRSQIIKRVPGATDKETPQAQAVEPGKTPATQTENSRKPSKDK